MRKIAIIAFLMLWGAAYAQDKGVDFDRQKEVTGRFIVPIET